MATRVSDGELAARVRQRNRANSERRRVKLAAGGKVQLLTWIPATLRSEIASLAAANGETVSQAAERLLLAALNATTRDNKPPDTQPVYNTVVGGDERTALLAEVGALLDGGMTGNEIARRFNSSGRRNSSGKPFIGANLLRDYRAWVKKAGADCTIGDTTTNNHRHHSA